MMASRVSTCESDISAIETKDGQQDSAISALQSKDTEQDTAIAGKLPLAGGTMQGVLIAQSNASYGTAQVRNVVLTTTEPAAGDGQDGTLWAVYE